jgi:hypothetical protein
LLVPEGRHFSLIAAVAGDLHKPCLNPHAVYASVRPFVSGPNPPIMMATKNHMAAM